MGLQKWARYLPKQKVRNFSLCDPLNPATRLTLSPAVETTQARRPRPLRRRRSIFENTQGRFCQTRRQYTLLCCSPRRIATSALNKNT